MQGEEIQNHEIETVRDENQRIPENLHDVRNHKKNETVFRFSERDEEAGENQGTENEQRNWINITVKFITLVPILGK